MRILYNFPTRSRRNKCFNCVSNIIENSVGGDFEIMIKADIDDWEMTCNEGLEGIVICNEKARASGGKVKCVWGESKNKVHAINRDIPEDGYDLLLTMSDDMVFTKYGFDLDIREAFENFDGLVHFPDQVAKDKLITFPMMTREYYLKFGYVYHPDFVSVYCDHEQQEVAKILGKYKFVDKDILRHEHAIWGFGEPDELLQKTEDPKVYARDKRTLEYHRSINFGL